MFPDEHLLRSSMTMVGNLRTSRVSRAITIDGEVDGDDDDDDDEVVRSTADRWPRESASLFVSADIDVDEVALQDLIPERSIKAFRISRRPLQRGR